MAIRLSSTTTAVADRLTPVDEATVIIPTRVVQSTTALAVAPTTLLRTTRSAAVLPPVEADDVETTSILDDIEPITQAAATTTPLPVVPVIPTTRAIPTMTTSRGAPTTNLTPARSGSSSSSLPSPTALPAESDTKSINVTTPVVAAIAGAIGLLVLLILGRLLWKRKSARKDTRKMIKLYEGQDSFEGGIYDKDAEKPIAYPVPTSPNPNASESDGLVPPHSFASPYSAFGGSSSSLNLDTGARSYDNSAPFFPTSAVPLKTQLPNTLSHTAVVSRPPSPQEIYSDHLFAQPIPYNANETGSAYSATSYENPFTSPILDSAKFDDPTPTPAVLQPQASPPITSTPTKNGQSYFIDSEPTIHVPSEEPTTSFVVADENEDAKRLSVAPRVDPKRQSAGEWGFLSELMGQEKK